MGYIRHDAIVVTSFHKRYLEPARRKADALGLPVSEIVESITNGYVSFLIAPDGSKEGWESSANGDAGRHEWKKWAASMLKEEDLFIEWVHISYAGDEEIDTKIVAHHLDERAAEPQS